ncbi:MAG: PDZ domain-containing protein [Pyrinomonadaceae bacterium]
MSFRHKVPLLVSLLLIGGIAYSQQTPAPAPPAPPAGAPMQGEVFGNAFSLLVDGGSFLGVYAEDIDKEKMSRYGLREPRGVGITGIVDGSPAEKAGLRKDDVILRFDNDSVTSVRKLNRLVSEVSPDQTVRLGISRRGTEQEVAVTIGKRKDSNTFEGLMKAPRGGVWGVEGAEGNKEPFVFAFGNNRRIGVSTIQLTRQLADYFGIADGKGVLVTSVTADGPAAKAGIKAGDVITAVDGEKIDGAGDLSRAINKKKEGDVALTVVREKNQRTITVTPKEGTGLVGPAQIGRRIVIPRIEIPAIPEVNIHMPRIEIPVIPEINIDVDLPARVRKARTQRPI